MKSVNLLVQLVSRMAITPALMQFAEGHGMQKAAARMHRVLCRRALQADDLEQAWHHVCQAQAPLLRAQLRQRILDRCLLERDGRLLDRVLRVTVEDETGLYGSDGDGTWTFLAKYRQLQRYMQPPSAAMAAHARADYARNAIAGVLELIEDAAEPDRAAAQYWPQIIACAYHLLRGTFRYHMWGNGLRQMRWPRSRQRRS